MPQHVINVGYYDNFLRGATLNGAARVSSYGRRVYFLAGAVAVGGMISLVRQRGGGGEADGCTAACERPGRVIDECHDGCGCAGFGAPADQAGDEPRPTIRT